MNLTLLIRKRGFAIRARKDWLVSLKIKKATIL